MEDLPIKVHHNSTTLDITNVEPIGPHGRKITSQVKLYSDTPDLQPKLNSTPILINGPMTKVGESVMLWSNI